MEPKEVMAAESYFTHARPEVRRLLLNEGPVLDVGCGSGALCADLVEQGVEVVGVEPHPPAAQEAAAVYTDVHVGSFDSFVAPRKFRQAVFADVLEHMYDPSAALIQARRDLLIPGARLITSIPNIRHWTIVRDLVFRGRWKYTEAGLLDWTHIRFFTQREAVALVCDSGYHVEAIIPHFERRLLRLLDVCSAHLLREFLVIQWLIVATVPDEGG